MRLERGQHRGRQDYGPLFLRTMRYSLRRALSLDSVDGGTHNPKVGGSNPPPPATIRFNRLRVSGRANRLTKSAGCVSAHPVSLYAVAVTAANPSNNNCPTTIAFAALFCSATACVYT